MCHLVYTGSCFRIIFVLLKSSKPQGIPLKSQRNISQYMPSHSSENARLPHQSGHSM